MLSCHQVRDLLPAIEAGEPAGGDVRDHLASCAPCRAEAAATRAELDRLRQELAVLAPSPLLEDRVLAAVREPARRAVRTRHPMRFAMFAGLAAAVLVAGVLIAAHLPEGAGDGATPDGARSNDATGDQGGGEGDTQQGVASGVVFPRTALDAERDRRRAKGKSTWTARFFTLQQAPQIGTAALGQGVLARIGAAAGTDTATRVAAGLARLTGATRKPTCAVEVLHPQTGARSWIRARIDTSYTGSLLLEEPLARALGLDERALPGTVTIEGAARLTAHRAQARVRIARIAFDESLEVQVRRAGDPLPAVPLFGGGIPVKPRIEIHGERPDMGFVGTKLEVHHLHDRIFISADRNVPWRETERNPVVLPLEGKQTLHAALEYRKGEHELCYVALPTVGAGTGGPLAWRMRLERVTLTQRFQPGAEIAIARVWRGANAVPSRESAAFTLADDKGRVSFVHVRGERGPLLVRERRTDGSVHWHTLAMDTEDVRVGPLRIALRKNGTAHVHGKVIPPPTDTPFVHGPQTWPALRTLLALVAGMAGFERKPDGASTLTVVVWAERGTPWKFVARVLMVCAAPDVRVASLRLELDQEAGAVPYELPRDRGLLPVDPSATKMAKLKLLLRRQDGTQTSWRLSDRRAQGSRQDVSADGPSLARAWTELTNRMGKAASRAATAKQPFVFEIVAWSDVPYADVRRAIAVALTLGIDDIRLSSSPR